MESTISTDQSKESPFPITRQTDEIIAAISLKPKEREALQVF
jgi:hypothetical protein